jgi:hypothetical protein
VVDKSEECVHLLHDEVELRADMTSSKVALVLELGNNGLSNSSLDMVGERSSNLILIGGSNSVNVCSDSDSEVGGELFETS